MQKRITLLIFAFFAINWLTAQNITFSGLLDSSVSLRAGAGDAPAFSYGVEEFANIRMQAKIREAAAFYGAVNLLAAAGDYAKDMAQMTGFLAFFGQTSDGITAMNYMAGIELERLYFRLNGKAVDFDGGLLRLPFGYGQVWGSSDFLNPKNPLKPDARPRAVLGAGLSWYPIDSLKLLAFGAAPHDPFSRSGEGGVFGISVDQHWDMASLQGLYSFESPHDGADKGIHRMGVSVKADVKVGLVMDALYTYNHEAKTGIDGLSLSTGVDYSFLDSKLIVLAEYLYNGKTSSTAFNPERNIFGLSREHYLYTGLTWCFNDFTNINVALISGFSDISFTPVITLNHDLFQGVTLIVVTQVPMDRDLFGNGKRGELGPHNTRRYFDISAKIRLRF